MSWWPLDWADWRPFFLSWFSIHAAYLVELVEDEV